MPRGRPKKKESNPKRAMEELLNAAVDAFGEAYDDREQRSGNAPTLRYVATELDTSILRARKLLITAGMFSTHLSRDIQRRFSQGESIKQIMDELGLGKASVYSYIPYQGLAFNLDETTVNADRHKLFRKRIKVCDDLVSHRGKPDEIEKLWAAILAFEGYAFQTSGRGNRPGVKFSYVIRRGANGEPTGEIKFSTKEKTVTRATVELAYRKAVEVQEREGCVTGPKKMDVFGASYLYSMFIRNRQTCGRVETGYQS